MKLLNTDIWNNELIATISGYSINDIIPCLYDLSMFISENLSPNRLADFDVEALKSVEAYNEIPTNVPLNLQNLQQ